MCGIVGIVGLTRPVDVAALQEMNDRQRHRGPDGEGFLLAWPKGGGGRFRHAFLPHTDRWDAAAPVTLGLGHRRLAILDLSDRGLQPLTVGDSDVWIVFNGEIYNHQELRAELQTLGHCFTTRTDTEVLLQAYRRWGEDCLARLDGMFAFAVWDGARGRLFCARDRLGIKPFYYATPPGAFIFASEIKALLAYPGLEARADDEAVVGFLVHANCDYGERTLLTSVKALAPAHALTLDAATGRFAPRAYWRLQPAAQNGKLDATRIDGLRELLLATTRRHLISDVPVGSCLSGGLDSSTVVSLIGKIWREQPDAAQALGDCFNTFTACYEQREVDEREYALAVAHSVGANPHLVFPAPDDFLETFARMAWHQDMPFGEMTYYAQWRVMRAAKDAGVKVLLDGQGGDEVFGGYAKFRYAYLASLLRSGRWIGLAKEFGATVLQGDRYVLNIRNGYRYLPPRLRRVLGVDSLLRRALRGDWDRAVMGESTPATRWWRYASHNGDGASPATVMQRMQVDDIMVDTLPMLLRMEDRSSMAFSLEARVPLLDHHVVEYGLSLPDRLKIRNGWSKFAMRQALQGIIPDVVRQRKTKLGFAVPGRQWLTRELRPQVSALIEDSLKSAKYVDPDVLRRWYRQSANKGGGRAQSAETYLGLFRLLSLEMWMRAFSIS
ncbi:MAG TPA: asparagine synthase (glutamine-hydrolyzing) [Gemmatimonadales bacterium]|nr:asparagine synthase (glutamine-hydrolyzing) [Gemmatimonadales bacterium]